MYEFRSRRPWGLRIRTGVPALVWVLAVPMAVAAQGAPSGGADPCVPGTPFQGTSLADYWTRAIETQRMLERSRDRKEVVFESVVFDRYVPFGVDIVESEGHDWLVSTTQIPFHSPETVVDRGFMIEEREDREIVRAYYGPGLSLFEHSSFSERYCLDLVEDPRTPDRIAVRFRPVEPGSDRTEVEGAFWFEADAGGPSGMEFRYLAPEGTSIAPELHGGWVEYGVEPGGEPIVTRWQLHMPWFDGSTSEALGTHIQGGELRSTIADEDEATRVPYVWPSAIRGSVYDSLNARPLADVEIRLEGTDYTTRTDESGEFYLAQLPSGGRYRLRYVHPRLNRRAYVAQDAWVEPRSGIVLHSDLAVPSAETLFGQVCAEGSEPSTTMIAGSIVDGESGLPMPNALVYASWEEGAGTVRRIDTRADDAGA